MKKVDLNSEILNSEGYIDSCISGVIKILNTSLEKDFPKPTQIS